MKKEESSDRVLNEARNEAIKKAHIPEIIKKSYDISLESGKVILNGKKRKR